MRFRLKDGCVQTLCNPFRQRTRVRFNDLGKIAPRRIGARELHMLLVRETVQSMPKAFRVTDVERNTTHSERNIPNLKQNKSILELNIHVSHITQ